MMLYSQAESIFRESPRPLLDPMNTRFAFALALATLSRGQCWGETAGAMGRRE